MNKEQKNSNTLKKILYFVFVLYILNPAIVWIVGSIFLGNPPAYIVVIWSLGCWGYFYVWVRFRSFFVKLDTECMEYM